MCSHECAYIELSLSLPRPGQFGVPAPSLTNRAGINPTMPLNRSRIGLGAIARREDGEWHGIHYGEGGTGWDTWAGTWLSERLGTWESRRHMLGTDENRNWDTKTGPITRWHAHTANDIFTITFTIIWFLVSSRGDFFIIIIGNGNNLDLWRGGRKSEPVTELAVVRSSARNNIYICR